MEETARPAWAFLAPDLGRMPTNEEVWARAVRCTGCGAECGFAALGADPVAQRMACLACCEAEVNATAQRLGLARMHAPKMCATHGIEHQRSAAHFETCEATGHVRRKTASAFADEAIVAVLRETAVELAPRVAVAKLGPEVCRAALGLGAATGEREQAMRALAQDAGWTGRKE